MTEHKQNWEDKFDEEFPEISNITSVPIQLAHNGSVEIKNFIRQELQSTRTATIQECMERIQSKLNTELLSAGQWGHEPKLYLPDVKKIIEKSLTELMN